ncbi:MAG TPA: hypothetical protein DET40_20930 [Lentisphaeria bacterium]|nr:MAG: hypothetical protein A2X45_15550 [Lentisphaerae bacterium GWF2_50_93]HCE46017.1 hypothetical protein [Lentisphaeria bacterium]
MRKWPKQHANLFAIGAFLLLAVVATHLFFIRPMAVKVRADRSYISTTLAELTSTGWPLDPGRLATYLQLKKAELNGGKLEGAVKDTIGMRRKSQDVINRCTSMLNNKIQKMFGNTTDFTHDVTRLDFQEEYNDLEQRLAGKNIFLTEEMLGLGENTQAQYTYQLMLQVWMLDRITSLIMDNNLTIQTDDKVVYQDEKGRKKAAAKLQFMPIIEYRLYDDDKTPYLYEIPLRFAIQGNTETVCKFLRILQSGGNFLPVSQIQVSSIPDVRNDDTQLSMETRNIRIEIECSAFFCPLDRPAGEPADRKSTAPKILPKGA